jgi:hypothetical protein
MALTLDRPHTRPRRRLSLRAVVAAGTGPLGVLAAAGLLTVGFLAAVASLVTRLG